MEKGTVIANMTDFERWRLEQSTMNIRDALAYQRSQIFQSIASQMATANLRTATVQPAPSAWYATTARHIPQYCCEDRTSHKPKITNCPNCGAPVTSCLCEYCGTRFD